MPLAKLATISSASAMTWLLVTISPDGVDDEAGAERLHRARVAAVAAAAVVVEEILEEVVAGRVFGASGSGVRREIATRCEVEM